MYSLYDFGDFDSSGRMGDPYVKLLSLIDPNEASADFVKDRGGVARTNITYTATQNDGGGPMNVSATDKMADDISKLVTYIPVILGFMGLNALALLIIAGVGACYFIRRRKHKSKKNKAGLVLTSRTSTPHPAVNNTPGDHEYERVSVHAPDGEHEDEPFTPPEPAFHNDGDQLRPLPGRRLNSFSRPRSMFSTMSGSPSTSSMVVPRDYRVSTAGSDVTAFVPPSPSFLKDEHDKSSRPKSIA